MAEFAYPPVSFETHPDRYRHWALRFDDTGAIATLTMQVQEDGALWDGRYELKLNSYDLGVDIELHDAIQRLRFEHPQTRVLVVTGPDDAKVFCAGANIRMLGGSPHAFKVNFCKYTNETRVNLEDAAQHSGLHTIAALNGTASGGGYELALACAEILLIDDGNAAVSLPEVPLLGVLPGTGGLTRITDKRRIRRDMADVFCTKAEGFRARDAKKHRFVDDSFPRSRWAEGVAARAATMADQMARAWPQRQGPGVALPPLARTDREDGWSYPFVDVRLDGRVAHLRVRGPSSAPTRAADTWSLQAFRELDDALLRLRLNHLDVGVLVLSTEGDRDAFLAHDAWLLEGAGWTDQGWAPGQGDWFLREVALFQARTLRRLDNMAKSLFARVEPGNAAAGVLFELVLAADRSFMLLDDDGDNAIALSRASAGPFPMANGLTRLQERFLGTPEQVGRVLAEAGTPVDAESAESLGLVTAAPDDIDWEDELRIAIEERVSLSPDALTGMEQNLRFGGAETCETKIYGRLSAWQNWIFQRPNAVGDRGALTMYGHPERPIFDYRRT
jgi:benzoyl-CoA-dihydrodiol lyase